jgi:hypothetical protein
MNSLSRFYAHAAIKTRGCAVGTRQNVQQQSAAAANRRHYACTASAAGTEKRFRGVREAHMWQGCQTMMCQTSDTVDPQQALSSRHSAADVTCIHCSQADPHTRIVTSRLATSKEGAGQADPS